MHGEPANSAEIVTVTITVTDVNEAPDVTGELLRWTFAEDGGD